jgi:Trk-type K+ transport system membrane component
MSLVDANIVPFQLSYFVLFTISALILLGNTIFLILLYIIIWCLVQIIPEGDMWQGQRNGLRLLNNKRSRILCPYLFTRSELFWLAGTILIFNGIDWVSLVDCHERPK